MAEFPSEKLIPHIMVVDDTPDNVRLLKLMLYGQYHIVPFHDAAQAIEAAIAEPPDLILLDVMMPGIDGYEAASRLKSDERTREIPIIFISALDDVESKVRAFTSGGVDFVTKPFHEGEIIARLDTHLALQELRRKLQAANAELARQNEALRERMAEIEALQAQLREQAIRDPLTNAFNRRYLTETLSRELARAEREGYPLSVVLWDVDFFKKFNDAYGHLAGDLVLQHLVDLINHQIRKGDALCRYGGEEFVVLMSNTSLENAYRRAEQLRIAVEESHIEHKGQSLGVTISLGVASYPEVGTDGDRLLNAADQAMYQAKAAGRNCTAVWQPLPENR